MSELWRMAIGPAVEAGPWYVFGPAEADHARRISCEKKAGGGVTKDSKVKESQLQCLTRYQLRWMQTKGWINEKNTRRRRLCRLPGAGAKNGNRVSPRLLHRHAGERLEGENYDLPGWCQVDRSFCLFRSLLLLCCGPTKGQAMNPSVKCMPG